MIDRDDLLGALSAAWRRSESARARLGEATASALATAYALLVRLSRRAKVAAFGHGPEDWPRKAAAWVLAILTAVPLWALTNSVSGGQELGGSSGWLLRNLLGYGSSGPAVVLITLFFFRNYTVLFRRAMIQKAARELGYSTATLRRLSAELDVWKDARRVVIQPDDDDVASLTEQFREALTNSEYNDRIRASRTPDLLALPPGEEAQEPTDDADDDDERDLTPAEQRKLMYMDLGTTLDFDRILWHLLAPAAIVLSAVLIVAGIWLSPVGYLVVGGLSLAVGVAHYRFRKWWLHRRVDRFSTPTESRPYGVASALVKTVDTGEIEVGMAKIAGRTYASPDLDALAECLATRGLERARGEPVSPAFEEVYAYYVQRKAPNYTHVRGSEKWNAMQAMLTIVRSSSNQIIPKAQLIERTVEFDRQTKWFGLRNVGFGYDPDLVREVYRDLYPAGLIESEVEITDADGEDRTVTAVTTRSAVMEHGIVALRAQFASEFGDRRYTPRYDVPEVPDDADVALGDDDVDLPDEDASPFAVEASQLLHVVDESSVDHPALPPGTEPDGSGGVA